MNVEHFNCTQEFHGGTFRDLFQEISVLDALGMDWGEDVLMNANGFESSENIRNFRDKLTKRQLRIPEKKEPEEFFEHAKLDYEALREACRESLQLRYTQLLALLDRALALGATVSVEIL